MISLADKAILSGADNRPPMLEKDMMILIKHGPLLWPTVEEDGVTRLKKYSELSAAETIQADCDIKATNIILQGLALEAKNSLLECASLDSCEMLRTNRIREKFQLGLGSTVT
nr:hypothetical protein [Tanacetum cinerariifolium]